MFQCFNVFMSCCLNLLTACIQAELCIISLRPTISKDHLLLIECYFKRKRELK